MCRQIQVAPLLLKDDKVELERVSSSFGDGFSFMKISCSVPAAELSPEQIRYTIG